MSSITKYKLKNGKELYRVQYTAGIDPLTSKPNRKSKRGFKTQREAKLWIAKTLTEAETYGFVKNTNITFKEAYESFMERYKLTVKASTYNLVEQMFRLHVLPDLGKKQIKKITVSMCQEAVNKWAQNYVGYHGLISRTDMVFKDARRQNIIRENPMSLIVYPTNVKANRHKLGDDKFWDKKELEIFLKASQKYFGGNNEKAIVIFRLLAFTGMRKGELMALQINDFDYKNGTLSINKTLTHDVNHHTTVGSPKSESGNRVIFLDQNTANILNHWIHTLHEEMLTLGYNTSSSEQLIFPNKKNKLLATVIINTWMIKVINSYNDDKRHKTKLKHISPHGLRHTWITIALESNQMTVKQIQKQVGDSDVSIILDTYAHVTKQAAKQTIDSFTNYVDIK